jgi:hypothetical protein
VLRATPFEDLERIQLGIDAPRAREKLVVASNFGDASALEHDDGVGASHGRKTMRDDE